MSTPNVFLRDNLRQSLQDVLSDISLDPEMMFAPAPAPYMDNSQFRQSQLELASSRSSILSHGSRSSFSVASAQMRPSATLGISSEKLMLAAATERRLLEENKMMMELEKARMTAAVRQRAIHQALEGRRRSQQSLVGFFHQGMGASSLQDFSGLSSKFMVKPQPVQHKDTLKQLGSSLREKSSPYVDVVDAADPDPNDTRVKKTRGGVTEPFPERLHRLLKEIADDGNGDVISFLGHGRAFAIHKPDKFVSEIITKYFKQKSLSSFQRQLNLYGFKRVASGRDAGAYYHDLFLQGRPNMCLLMRRVGLPKGDDRRKMRSKTVQVDPDFYTMKSAASPTSTLTSC